MICPPNDDDHRMTTSRCIPPSAFLRRVLLGLGVLAMLVPSGGAGAQDAGRPVYGRVLDLEGRPLEGARVFLVSRPDGQADRWPTWTYGTVPRQSATSDATGTFTIRGVPSGPLDFWALHETHGPYGFGPLDVPPGEAPWDVGALALAPSMSIEGWVLDRDGQPVAGARTEAEMALPEGLGFRFIKSTASDGDGYFRIDGWPVGGTPVHLRAWSEGYFPETLDSVWLGPEAATIILTEMTTLAGRVVDERRAPVIGAWIRTYEVEREPDHGQIANLAATGQTSTGADGRFKLEAVRPGEVRLDVRAEDFLEVTRDLEVPAAGLADVVISLEEGATLRGLLLDAGNHPVAGAVVRLRPADPRRIPEPTSSGVSRRTPFVSTNTDGTFAVFDIPSGRHFVRFATAGGVDLGEFSFTARSGTVHEVDFRLEDGAGASRE